MCRIFGTFGAAGGSGEVLELSRSQFNGGPDYNCFVHGKTWSLGVNRLAVVGLDGGRQPFCIGDDIFVVFVGEIYNYQELREDLRQCGVVFDDSCDGAVIPYLYEKHGDDFVELLDGMFAIAIVDQRPGRESLRLYSDCAGIKSLFYAYDNNRGVLRFSSDLGALQNIITSRLSLHRIDDYLALRTVWGPETIYESIRTLQPGESLVVTKDLEPKLRKFGSVVFSGSISGNLSHDAHSLRDLLDQEIHRMVAVEVPLCFVLSGGLDSSLTTVLGAQHLGKIDTFHICYDGSYSCDERRFARLVADHVCSNHHEIVVYPKEMPEIMEKAVRALGQPNSAPHNLSTYCLFKAIGTHGFKVAITGEGADEFFAGYGRFAKAFLTESEWMVQYLNSLAPFTWNTRRSLYTETFAKLLDSVNTRSKWVVTQLTELTESSTRLERLLEIDQCFRFPYYILRRVDHLSMYHSVEVRVPFCQPRVVDFARKVPLLHKTDGYSVKRILYEAARGVVPGPVLERKKQPFTLPIAEILREKGELFDFIQSLLSSRSFKELEIFRPEAIEGLFKGEITDSEAMTMWCLGSLALWLKNEESRGAV